MACGTCCGSEPDPASGHVFVLLGDGKDAFRAAAPPLRAGAGAGYVTVADLDGDGRADVVAGCYRSGEVAVFLAR